MSITAVARHANLSVSTVSRFLKGELRVSPATEARIQDAMVATGFRQEDPGVRRLAVIVPELTNPFFSTLCQALVVASAARGVITSFHVSGGVVRNEAALCESCALDSRVDGIVIMSLTGDGRVLDGVPRDFPVVVLDERLEGVRHERSYVGSDDFGGAYQATSYLVTMGHRSVAFASGPAELRSSQERRSGYLKALADNKISVDHSLIFEGQYSEAHGAAALLATMRHPARPTAIFAGSDIVAIGVMSAAGTHGVSIPGDLSLIGFDGIDVTAWLSPPLSTVEQSFDTMARAALDCLDAASQGQHPVAVTLPMRFLSRASVAAVVKPS